MDAYTLLIFCIIACCAQFVTTIPQIFTDKYNHCDYERIVGKKIKKLTFPDKLWTIDRRDFTIHFSLCGSRLRQCRNESTACLIKKDTNDLIHLGKEFKVDSDDFTLESQQGAKCTNSGQNYTLTVTFACSDAIKTTPRLMLNEEEDDCRYEVMMKKPDCKPKCTDIIQGAYLLDIRNFPKNIPVKYNNQSFSLSPCGTSSSCGSSGASSCEIINGNFIALAEADDSQILNYDVGKNELTARGRFRQGAKVKRDIQILIKCNWDTELSNPVFKKSPRQGRMYRFELESSYGCIKLPQICTTSSLDNLHYNLSQLNNINGWLVTGIPDGSRVLLNICGPLNQLNNNTCSVQESQVCQYNGGSYINRGSILSSLTAEYDILRAVFMSGSTCRENNTLSYSTQVEFKCSRDESGPIFKDYGGCVMVLTWNTPHACSVDYYTGENCHVRDFHGNRDLKTIYAPNDKHYWLSPETQVIYNLCGPLHSTCNNHTNASFCLKTNQNENVLGWDRRQLISEKGGLRMAFTGELCWNQRNQAEVFADFVCNYQEPSPSPLLLVLEDNCKFNVTIYTPLACFSPNNFDKCVYKQNNTSYDLSPLVFKNQNYVIPGDYNIDFIFNLCGPVITEPDVLCGHNTMVCLRNKTELNPRKQFISLGGVGGPVFENNSLVVEAKMGTYCGPPGYYRSFFHFSCSPILQLPVFIGSDPCVYHFKWEVPEACTSNCEIRSSSADQRLNLWQLEKKTLKINVDNFTNYDFYLCKDFYIQNVKGDLQTLSLTRDLFIQNNKSYLILKLHEECKSKNSISKVLIEVQCYDKPETVFERESFSNCVLSMTIQSRIFCSSVPVYQTTTLKNFEPKNCSVNSTATGYDFELKTLKSAKKKYGSNEYSINFNGQSNDCNGVLCKNNTEMLPVDECPHTLFNNSDRSVTLYYTPRVPCNSHSFYDVEIQLKCNDTKTEENLKEIEQCKLVLEYNLPNVCLLFKQKASEIEKSSISDILGITFGVIIILFSVVVIYLNRRRCFRSSYMNISRSNKNSVPIYCRDATE